MYKRRYYRVLLYKFEKLREASFQVNTVILKDQAKTFAMKLMTGSFKSQTNIVYT